MSTNHTNQSLKLRDGRKLGFAAYGPSTGQPVFHFHGSGSSRLEHPASDELLFQLDIRFISVDRPGHGLSDFQPNRRLLDWPQDIQQLADQLSIQGFYVTGHSAGGPHALACAHQLPERVLAAAAISSVAPMGRPNAYAGMPWLNQILAKSARQAPWITQVIRRLSRGMVLGDPEKASQRFMASIPEADKAVLYAPRNIAILTSSLREGFRQDARGVAQDDCLVNQDWGFSLKQIKQRVDIWHGDQDVNVPLHAGQYLEAELPETRTFFLSGEGHFFLLNRWREVLSALVNASYVRVPTTTQTDTRC
jgi:pimeloyl-ACP methyl ester carboxylesterase